MACKETGTLNTQGHPQNAGTSLPVLLGGVWWTWCTCQARICCTKSCWAFFSFSQTLWFLIYCTSDIYRSGFKQNATCHSVPICLGFTHDQPVSLLLYVINLYPHCSRYSPASSTLAGTLCIPGCNLWQFTAACFISLASNSYFEHVLCIVNVYVSSENSKDLRIEVCSTVWQSLWDMGVITSFLF